MNFYTKYHCLIERNSTSPNIMIPVTLQVKEVEMNPVNYEYLLNRVGSPWCWTERPKYLLEKNSLYSRIYDKKSRFFLLKKGENLIGYCFATTSSENVAKKFKNIIEIENFGFFPEHTGKGYGSTILNMIFDVLFEDYNNIYLTSRSTNHPKVIDFYQKNGMKVICKENLPDDLVTDWKYSDSPQKSAA